MSSQEPVFWTPILYDVAHAFESVADPEARVDRVLALMRRFVPYDRCALLEATPVLGRRISIEPRAPADDRDALAERLRSMLALLSESPIDQGPPIRTAPVSERVHLAVPIIGLGEITGIVFVEREAPAYDQSHLAFLSVIAAQIGAYLAAVRSDRELRASESRFRKLYESGMIGIAFLDAEGTILDVNETFAAILGRSRAELSSGGASWHGLTPPEYRERDEAALSEALERGRCLPYEKQFRCAVGRPVSVLAGAACIEATDVLVAFVLDITEQKRVQTERARLLEQRESDIEFLEMFMGMLGHDLRNPLGAIRMSAELLAAGQDVASQSAGRILSSSERMERMVDQLLDLTRIRLAGGMLVERAPVDLHELCQRSIDELLAAHPEAAVHTDVDGDVTGEWDGDRLAQVVSNLLGNAIQHAADATAVRLSLQGSGASVELRTHNAGFIPADLLPVLFDPFRGSQQNGGRQGLGLGLFISKYIVEAHGGSIEVDSCAERGTTFTVRLPRRA